MRTSRPSGRNSRHRFALPRRMNCAGSLNARRISRPATAATRPASPVRGRRSVHPGTACSIGRGCETDGAPSTGPFRRCLQMRSSEAPAKLNLMSWPTPISISHPWSARRENAAEGGTPGGTQAGRECSPLLGWRRGPVRLQFDSLAADSHSREAAANEGDRVGAGDASGRRFMPPPQPPHTVSEGESGRERPPSLARCVAQRSFEGGRSRPDSKPRPFRNLRPSTRPTHGPPVLPTWRRRRAVFGVARPPASFTDRVPGRIDSCR